MRKFLVFITILFAAAMGYTTVTTTPAISPYGNALLLGGLPLEVGPPLNGEAMTYNSGSGQWEYGTVGVSYPLLGDDASAAAPTYSFSNQTNSGMYRDTGNIIKFAVQGTDLMHLRIDSILAEQEVLVDSAVTSDILAGFSVQGDSDTGIGFQSTTDDGSLSIISNATQMVEFDIGDANPIDFKQHISTANGKDLTINGGDINVNNSGTAGMRIHGGTNETMPSGAVNVDAHIDTFSLGDNIGINTRTYNNASPSGSLYLETGNNSTGDSGDVTLYTGTAGGTRGDIIFKDGSEGTAGHVWTSTGVNGEGGWAAAAGGGHDSLSLKNISVTAALSTNDLVISLKQIDGSTDCSSGSSSCKAMFRNPTLATAGFAEKEFTAAESITLEAQDSIGTDAAATQDINVYLISDTTSEICVSLAKLSEDEVHSATALTAGAETSSTTLYCDSAHTSRPIRSIGTVRAAWSNPNWGSVGIVSKGTDNGKLVNYVVYTSGSGTYTTPSGVKTLFVQLNGSGGGGGGAPATAAGEASCGSGGGAGGYVSKLISTPAASYTYSLGSGGTGGNGTTPTNGGNGSSSNFNGTSFMVAYGGYGGTTGAAQSAIQVIKGGSSNGQGGSNTYIQINGGAGGPALCAGVYGFGGAGGIPAGPYSGTPGNPPAGDATGDSANGSAGYAAGAGGSGALSLDGGTAKNGATGNGARLFITEYY